MYRFIGLVVSLVFIAVFAGIIAHSLLSKKQRVAGKTANAEFYENLPQCGAGLEIEPQDFAPLYDLGRRSGVDFPATFARVVDYLYDENQLPSCYMIKSQARSMGWKRGMTLDQAAPGRSIGGNHFHNREEILPAKYNGSYREADLDYVSGTRNAHRLVYVSERADEGLIWLTTDHYNSFIPIYCGDFVCD